MSRSASGPTEPLNARFAGEPHDGCPALTTAMMDEARVRHLGIPRPDLDAAHASEQLRAGFDAPAREDAGEPPAGPY